VLLDVGRSTAARARKWRTAWAFFVARRRTARVSPEFCTREVDAAVADFVTPRERRPLERWVLPPGPSWGSDADEARAIWRKLALMDSTDRRPALLAPSARACAAGGLPMPRGQGPGA